MEEVGISRREMVVVGAVGVVAAGAMCCGMAGCGVMQKEDDKKIIKTGVVSIGAASRYPAGSVHQDWLHVYGIVVTNGGGTVMAIGPRCTHLYCTVKWVAADYQFECPCHGSRFNLEGEVTNGPAKRPLAAVGAVTGADGELRVDLDRLYGI